MVTFSTAKSLVRLRELHILGCDMITGVVAADEGDEATDYEIVFSQLKELHLLGLESLANFCSTNSILKFPSLEELVVENCPKMKSFSGGELSTPKLQKVTYNRRTRELRKGDLNTTVQELHDEMSKYVNENVMKTEDVAGNGNLWNDSEDDVSIDYEEDVDIEDDEEEVEIEDKEEDDEAANV
ncbi:Disease resistance protein [Melia azedarach]|uniref:Disease resistance protein n=1 Tax=Melia azedarach TaxID=155640 RepID=A0ACC1YDG3_MELAZ|nr:Disease resistance protein [Melia azedarach]